MYVFHKTELEYCQQMMSSTAYEKVASTAFLS